MSKKIFIKTFGCQMNEYDSNRILDLTKQIGYTSTKNISEANCYVLNTCHIREKATDRVYHDVGRVKKEFRNKKKPLLIITGCVAQAEGEIMLKREKYIDAIVGPQSYHTIPKIIKNLEKKKSQVNSTEFNVIEKFDKLKITKNSSSKISSFLTIQEGCDKFCKFCVVPYTRGPEFSRPFDQIISEALELIKNGTKEITLLGQNVNAYNFEGKKLSNILYELERISDLKRIRYTTSHPKDMTDDLIEAHKSLKKLMPLLHLPVQSGSSKILKNMNRKHDINNYLETVEKLKNINPNIKFSSDFIIAYPGEEEKDFQQTIDLMKKVEFINSYSFIFNSRPGTPAAKLKKVDLKLAKKRLKVFQELSNQIKKKYREKILNTTVNVLFENKTKDQESYFGRDLYSNAVIVKSEENLIGKTLDIYINNFNHNTLFGDVKLQEKNKYVAA